MAAIKVNGKSAGKNLLPQQHEISRDILNITCTQEILLSNSDEQVELQAAAPDTLLELEFDGGYKRWIRVRQLLGQLSVPQGQTLCISPYSFNLAEAKEGASLLLKSLRVLDIGLADGLDGSSTLDIISRLEARYIPNPGLYRCTENTFQKDALADSRRENSFLPEVGVLPVNTAKPVLLFIHGIFSCTASTFRDLWEARSGYNASAWLQRLFSIYDRQVYALEQHTLTVSPVQNALQALRQLPENTRLHLITHSSGGMVGELLCQAGVKRRTRASGEDYLDTEEIFTQEELSAFAGTQNQAERDGLLEIARLLHEKQIRVERFIRVACPIRGTVLATEPFEDSFSIVSNVLNRLDDDSLSKTVEFVRVALMATAAQDFQPNTLPGLEALKPSSGLVRLLNRPNVCQASSELAVIAGNIKASSLLGLLRSWAAKCFSGADNDYLVNTASMFGGIARKENRRFYIEQSNTSSHFSYFRNLQVLDRIANALQDREDALLQVLDKGYAAPRQRSGTHQPTLEKDSVLYFLPGFMGSTLQSNGNTVWLNQGALEWGDFTTLKVNQPNVVASGMLENAYRPLLDTFGSKYRTVEFAYDWRCSTLESGRQLGEMLAAELDQAWTDKRKLTVKILAHSSGGLVLLGMMSEQPALWQRLQEEANCRCVLLGTPLQGSFAIVQLLLGKHRLTRLLDMTDGQARENTALADQFSEYPGILEQLPVDYFDEGQWRNVLGERFIDWPARQLLAEAQRVHTRLRTALELDTRHLVYVQGKAQLTPSGLEADGENWRFRATGEGDGVTLWANAGFKGQQWFMPVEHGRMASHPGYFTALQSLLTEGRSYQLDQVPPQTGVAKEQWLPEIHTELFPDEAELQAAALGYHTSLTAEEARPQIEVGLMHGNLEYVSNTLAVGHYAGDGILSTERVLDDCLQGRLTELQRMNRYPGSLKTSAVLFNPGKRPGGALIIGLGEVGKLTASNLLASFLDALIHYALDVRSNMAYSGSVSDTATDFIPVTISSLLVGTMGGGLSLSDCIASILRAVTRANLMLDKSETGMKMRFTRIEFVELYEDRAVEATRILRSMEAYPEFHLDFSFKKLMGKLPGNRRRVIYRDTGDWWRRLQIELHEDGLKYTALTERARAELMLHSTQRKLVDQIIAQAVSSSKADPELGKILFELLLPSEMKEQAPSAENLVLVVDAAAGNYPWELLQDRRNPDAEPLSVRSGMVRQLMVGQFKGVRRGVVERSALVVGNPLVDKGFIDLPNAQAEAENVAKQLEEGGFTKVVQEIHSDSKAVLHALLTGDYRVMHLAGHGVFGYKIEGETKEIVTGMVLGDGIFLTPVEIEQMRTTPDFVFINCCNLAKMDTPDIQMEGDVSGRHGEFASGFAQALIRLGVKAVVASGWEVDDDAAKLFSETCYRLLLEGQSFGKAVQVARSTTWKHRWKNTRESNTWGAYQCYGDPEYRLVSNRRDEAQSETRQDKWCFVAEVEVVIALQNLANEADTSQESRYPDMRNTIKSLHNSIPLEWLDNADILYGLGRVYSKLEMYPEALNAYQAAIDSPKADYPVVLLEDKVSLQTAWALGCAEGRLKPAEGREKGEFVSVMMRDAYHTLELLGDLGNSLQRLEEEGKYWKRQCIMASATKRDDMLKKMEDAYELAHKFALQVTGDIAVYPLTSWLTARVIRNLRGDLKHIERRDMQGRLQEAQQKADAADRRMPSFMSGITRAECLLLDYLLQSSRLEETTRLRQAIDCYEEAIKRGGAPRKVCYVTEHLNFIKLMLADHADKRPQLQPVIQALLGVETKLPVCGG